ncbi:hypothetical protein JTB14_013554 [Gonioctena quinquepunctata]|nr:hypothetical protein JTB14_013554 [Gonioctena quinquepunctata]
MNTAVGMKANNAETQPQDVPRLMKSNYPAGGTITKEVISVSETRHQNKKPIRHKALDIRPGIRKDGTIRDSDRYMLPINTCVQHLKSWL